VANVTDIAPPLDERVDLALFGDYAGLSANIQRRIVESRAKPNESKTLRLFPTSEAAELVGLSETHFRALRRERPDFPEGTVVGGNNRRAFTLAEINTMRDRLLETTGDQRYRVRRVSGALPVITFANFKGGAAKTTSAVHAAQYFALKGRRVLLVDLDSQGSLTSIFGFQPDEDFTENDTLYPFLRGEIKSLRPLVRRTYWDTIDLIPANLSLFQSEFELPLMQHRDRNFRFWRLLQSGLESVADDYDIVVCDCPPSLGYLSINAIYAATGLVVPVPPSMLDYASTGQFFRMMHDTLATLGQYEKQTKIFDFVRILIAKFNPADQNHKQIARWMSLSYRERVMENRMVVTTALDMAGLRKETLYESGASGNKRTSDRALDHMNAVNAELLELVIRTMAPAHSGEVA
jgi:chromosome partitioning protein